MATTVAKGAPVELTSHTPILMDIETESSSLAAELEEDLYTRLKTLQRQLEFYEIQVCVLTKLICFCMRCLWVLRPAGGSLLCS